MENLFIPYSKEKGVEALWEKVVTGCMGL